VARGVDDVDDDRVTLRRLVVHGGVLGEDRDALLALQVHRVHHPVSGGRPGMEGARLREHGVHQGGLPVVDVGDDGDVAEIRADWHISIVPEPGSRGRVGRGVGSGITPRFTGYGGGFGRHIRIVRCAGGRLPL
jgi:hypothetical protein